MKFWVWRGGKHYYRCALTKDRALCGGAVILVGIDPLWLLRSKKIKLRVGECKQFEIKEVR